MGSRTAVLFYRTDRPEDVAADLAQRHGQQPPEEEDFLPKLIAAAKMMGMDDAGIQKLLQDWKQVEAQAAKSKQDFNNTLRPEHRQAAEDWELPQIIQGSRFVSLAIYDVIRNENIESYAKSESEQIDCPVFAFSNFDDFVFSSTLYVHGQKLFSCEHVLDEDFQMRSFPPQNVITVDFRSKTRVTPPNDPVALFRDVLGLDADVEELKKFFHEEDFDQLENTAQRLTGIPFSYPERLILKERLPHGLWYTVAPS